MFYLNNISFVKYIKIIGCLFGVLELSSYLCYTIIIIYDMKISKTIKEHGFTIQQVADAIGLQRSSLANTIGGNPTVETLRKIAEAIGCNITEFFSDEEYASKEVGLTALVDYNGTLYRADSVGELEMVAEKIKTAENERK